MTQEPPLKFFLAAPEIPYRVTRRTSTPTVSQRARENDRFHTSTLACVIFPITLSSCILLV